MKRKDLPPQPPRMLVGLEDTEQLTAVTEEPVMREAASIQGTQLGSPSSIHCLMEYTAA